MSSPDSRDQHGQFDVTPPSNGNSASGVPPVIQAVKANPQNRRRLNPLVVITICVAGLIVFAGAGALAVGMFLRSQSIVHNAGSRGAAVDIRDKSFVRANAFEAGEARAERLTAFGARQPKFEPGLSYTNIKVPREPWSIHVLKIERGQKDLTFFAAHAAGRVLSVSLIAEQARSVPPEIGRAIAGVNGDFYVRDTPTFAGDPRGLQIMNGELLSAPDTVCVWFDAEDNPHLDEVKGEFNVTWSNGRKTPFGLNQQRDRGAAVLYTPSYGTSTRVSGGHDLILEKEGNSPWLPLQVAQTYRARVREIHTNGNARLVPNTMLLSLGPQLLARVPDISPGDVLEISTSTTPDLKGVKTAIGGGPAIIKDGKPFAAKNPPPSVALRNFSEASKYQRHPRAAVGWSPSHIYLVIVDGRQPGLSMGMKLAELAEFMAGLGCTEAMNFDGGKSAQLWMSAEMGPPAMSSRAGLGSILNSPCQGEDTVANSLLVVRRAKAL